MQQARRRAARVRGQGVAAGQRVLQVPHHRHGRRVRQLAARPLVRRPRHHRRLRAARQLPLPVPGRHDGAHPTASYQEPMSGIKKAFNLISNLQLILTLSIPSVTSDVIS